MSRIYLPDKAAREIQKERWVEERQKHRAVINELLDFDDPVCREWNPHLQGLDPKLRMARARPTVKTGWGVIPGLYHWVRDNETAAPTVTPITGPDGESFREPDSGVLEELKRSDLQNPTVFLALLEQRKEQEEARQRRIEANRTERQEEIVERYLAASRTQVSTSDVPWTQNVKGARGRKV